MDRAKALLAALAIINLAALAAVGWLAWDARRWVIAMPSPSSDPNDEPEWARRLWIKVNEAQEEAHRAARSADDAAVAAKAVCEEIKGHYSCG